MWFSSIASAPRVRPAPPFAPAGSSMRVAECRDRSAGRRFRGGPLQAQVEGRAERPAGGMSQPTAKPRTTPASPPKSPGGWWNGRTGRGSSSISATCLARRGCRTDHARPRHDMLPSGRKRPVRTDGLPVDDVFGYDPLDAGRRLLCGQLSAGEARRQEYREPEPIRRFRLVSAQAGRNCEVALDGGTRSPGAPCKPIHARYS